MNGMVQDLEGIFFLMDHLIMDELVQFNQPNTGCPSI